MSQESPVTPQPRPDDEHHEGQPEHNPFVSDGAVPEQPAADVQTNDDHDTTVHPVVAPVADPDQEFSPVADQQDHEPTQEFAPAEADVEPTQEFAPEPTEPSDPADHEATQEFASDQQDNEPTQEFAPVGEAGVEPTEVVPPVADPSDHEPTQEFAPVGEADVEPTEVVPPVADPSDHEPTQEFAPVADQQDYEPTQEFAPEPTEPSDPADHEATQEFAPVADQQDYEPTQEFTPQPGDPEPTMALPITDDEAQTTIRPMSARTPSEPYQRPPVFSPRGFEPIPEPDQANGAAGVGGAAAAGAFAGAAAVGPQESPEQRDARIMQEHAAEQERARAVEAEAARRREAAEVARQRSLGTITPEQHAFEPERPLPPRRSTDKLFGSLGIFVLRIALAGILAIRGYQMITDIPGTRDLLSQIGMPWLEYLPWALAIAHGLAALALIFGLGVRVVGVCVTALAVCALALVKWGVVPVFQDGMPGFVGELEVLMAAVGFVLLTLGSGGWGMDAGWRHNRWRDKYGTD